jgi:hypothetical protein
MVKDEIVRIGSLSVDRISSESRLSDMSDRYVRKHDPEKILEEQHFRRKTQKKARFLMMSHPKLRPFEYDPLMVFIFISLLLPHHRV